MASACEIVVAGADAAQLAEIGSAEVRRIEAKYSRYRPQTVVARINAQAGGDWVECDPETDELLNVADQLYRSSGGLFDASSGVLRKAWDFKLAQLPDADTLAQAAALVGWDRVQRRVGQVRLPMAGMEIDFGGFGKEYAADRAATAIAGAGGRHGYVNLAGDIRVFGPKPDGAPWVVGIQDPRQADRLVASIPLTDGALATSGDYERYFELDGQRYCHILDPRSGWPVRHWRSVSVLAPQAIGAGACATIAMLRQEDAIAFLEATGLRYLAIDWHGTIHKSNARNATS
ncbi:MAG: FAD:protein FMN transferase [Pseudomonadota bacterium]